jgi:hypothetical protein
MIESKRAALEKQEKQLAALKRQVSNTRLAVWHSATDT